MKGCCVFFFQAEDGIRDLVRSRGLGDVYKRQVEAEALFREALETLERLFPGDHPQVATSLGNLAPVSYTHLTLPTSDLV